MSVKNLFIAVHIMFGVFALYTSNNYAAAMWVFTSIWSGLLHIMNVGMFYRLKALEAALQELTERPDGLIGTLKRAIEKTLERAEAEGKDRVKKGKVEVRIRREEPSDDPNS